MQFYLHLDGARARLYVRARGTWALALAEAFREDMRNVRQWVLQSGRTIAILTDLSDLSVHAQDIAPVISEGAQQVFGLPVSAYAMIVPTALMRMQVRRIDPLQQERRLFETVEDAAAWLGWGDFVPIDLERPGAPMREVVMPAPSSPCV